MTRRSTGGDFRGRRHRKRHGALGARTPLRDRAPQGGLGATKCHVWLQFVLEALMLSGLGGAVGVVLGALVTAGYSIQRQWSIVVPPVVIGGAALLAVVIGATAGLYSAIRAARLPPPTEALRTA